MLLRQLTKHLKDQNWTAVWLDFFIVVLGVFMGIQVQGWYETQREEKLVQDYLHRLNEDFSLSIAGTERTKVFVTSNLNNLSVVLNSIRSCSIKEKDRGQFANGLFHMGKLIPAQFVDGTLEELRASGRLLLVESNELRQAINETVREHEYQARVWPALQGRAGSSRNYITDSFIFWLEGPVNGFSNITWAELEFDLESVCGDQALKARLSDLHRISQVSINWLDRNLENFRAVKKHLDEELGQSSNRGS